jgi:hypothetical protein
MLINKDYDHSHPVRIVFRDAERHQDTSFSGKLSMITFGREQYRWHPARKKGHADPDGPLKRSELNGEENTQYMLPPASVTVLRGRLR